MGNEAVFGPGRLVLTLEPEEGERYQGIVPLLGANLAEALETYFRTSEQLGTQAVAGRRSSSGRPGCCCSACPVKSGPRRTGTAS